MQIESRVADVGVLVDVVNALGVERRCTPLDAMNLIALSKKEFGQTRVGLAGDECLFHG